MTDLIERLKPIIDELMKRHRGYLQNNDPVMADNYERYALRVAEAIAALEQAAKNANYEAIAQKLFALLDDIDTADDIAKDNDVLFRNLVRLRQQQRFKFGTVSEDGMNVVIHNSKEK